MKCPECCAESQVLVEIAGEQVWGWESNLASLIPPFKVIERRMDHRSWCGESGVQV